MEPLVTCPECGSDELRNTTRVLADLTSVDVTVCGACHWASDLRVGRPPADRSKNVTLRRLLHGAEKPSDGATTPDEPS